MFVNAFRKMIFAELLLNDFAKIGFGIKETSTCLDLAVPLVFDINLKGFIGQSQGLINGPWVDRASLNCLELMT